MPLEKHTHFEILRTGEVPAADPELPAGRRLRDFVCYERNLGMPTAEALVMGLLDHELVKNPCNSWQRDGPRYPPALNDDPHAVAQLINRFREIDRRAGAFLVVATDQRQQHRCNCRQVYRITREQCQADGFAALWTERVKIRLSGPCGRALLHAPPSRSRRRRFTLPQR